MFATVGCGGRIIATRFAGLRHATGSHEVEHAVGTRTLYANFEAAIVA